MKPLVTSIALLGVAGLVSLGGAVLVSHGASELDHRTASLASSTARSVGLLQDYDLRRLPLVDASLHEIDVRYVDLTRVDYQDMFDAALTSTERLVPTTLFRREAGSALLHVQVGFHHTVVELPPIRSRATLHAALRDVAGLVAEHVNPSDIPVDDGKDPWATVEYAMINGMLGTLDPHSRMLPPEDSREMDVENSGEFGGLGITIIQRDGQLTIEYPLPDTPAANVGLQADDRIVRIDGESTINMGLQEAVRRLRGKVGSSVRLTIERGTEPEPLIVTIVRDRIKMNPVEGEILSDGIAVVSIKSFHANVAGDLDTTLRRLAGETQRGRLSGLILDLRGNPGGYLSQAIAVSNKFLEDGLIVKTRGRGARDETEEAQSSRTEPRYPIAVLIDASSASASEIVAGALRNNDRAITIGERSFGKGSVQNLESFFDGSKLKLTIAQYYTPPGDQSIQSVGIPADIQIVPTVAEASGATGLPLALVHYRERVRRESDFERGLARQIEVIEPPTYTVRTLRESGPRRRGPTLDHLRSDPQVLLARDVLMAAGGRSSRSEVLTAAAPVVDRARDRAERELVDAFERLDIDWTAGPPVDRATLDVTLDLGDDGKLRAGEEEEVWLQVTNRGDAPLHRVVAVSHADTEALDGREFVLGRIEPGQTARFPQLVSLSEGYPTEQTPIRFTFRDDRGATLTAWSSHLQVEGKELPRLAWRWRVIDGDEDGMLSEGERAEIELTVTNVGEGPTSEAFARLRNESGRALDLLEGTLEIGELRDEEGAPCAVPEAVDSSSPAGDTDSGEPGLIPPGEAFPDAGVTPQTEAGACSRVLRPGESWTGSFAVQLTEAADWSLELTVGDARAYDYASVMRGNFYETFTNSETLSFAPEQPLVSSRERVPPQVTLSRGLAPQAERGAVTVSGRVTDEHGLAHLVVYHNEQKVVFADGGKGLRSLPFTADLDLEPGLNTVVIIATDDDGLQRTRSVVTSFQPPQGQASAQADAPTEP